MISYFYDTLFYLIILIFLFIIELFYFWIASINKIIDKPNIRSSHSHVTIRGGGVIFSLSVFFWFFLEHSQYFYFLFGLVLVTLISFLDDIRSLHRGVRFLFQSLAILLLFYQLQLRLDWYWYIGIFILVIGTINAYNFMDGINGITGSYSIVIVGTLWYINHYEQFFTYQVLLTLILLSLLVFSFFNFRKQAHCFAGDVGSVSMAFIIVFLLLLLIRATGNFLYIAFLLIYGLDSVTTIIFRLIRKENIFEAHRSHFYQFLANEKKWSHLMVSGLYAGTQLVINLSIINAISLSDVDKSLVNLAMLILSSGIIFLLTRFLFEGKKRLTGK